MAKKSSTPDPVKLVEPVRIKARQPDDGELKEYRVSGKMTTIKVKQDNGDVLLVGFGGKVMFTDRRAAELGEGVVLTPEAWDKKFAAALGERMKD